MPWETILLGSSLFGFPFCHLTASWQPVLWPMSTQALQPCSLDKHCDSRCSSDASWSKEARPHPCRAQGQHSTTKQGTQFPLKGTGQGIESR